MLALALEEEEREEELALTTITREIKSIRILQIYNEAVNNLEYAEEWKVTIQEKINSLKVNKT